MGNCRFLLCTTDTPPHAPHIATARDAAHERCLLLRRACACVPASLRLGLLALLIWLQQQAAPRRMLSLPRLLCCSQEVKRKAESDDATCAKISKVHSFAFFNCQPFSPSSPLLLTQRTSKSLTLCALLFPACRSPKPQPPLRL